MAYDEICAALSAHNNFQIVLHTHADVDAVASGYALLRLLHHLGKEGHIITPDKENVYAAHFANELEIDIKNTHEINPEHFTILVDVSGKSHTEPLCLPEHYCVIDHHAYQKGQNKHFIAALRDEHAGAAAQLMYRLYKEFNIEPEKKVCFALIAGIYTDTAGLRLATNENLQTISYLLEISDITFSEVVNAISVETDISKRIARLKGCQRSTTHKIGNHLIITSKISSFEADVASSLLRIGADCSIVASEKKHSVRISMRAKKTFLKATGFHVSRDLLRPTEKMLNGTSGGHDGAGSLNGTGDVDAAVRHILNIIKNKQINSPEVK